MFFRGANVIEANLNRVVLDAIVSDATFIVEVGKADNRGRVATIVSKFFHPAEQSGHLNIPA
ncbi:MAG: hypothetical protein ACI87E_003332 [Mariniblastus sp.]|jgi:hypothetical protein